MLCYLLKDNTTPTPGALAPKGQNPPALGTPDSDLDYDDKSNHKLAAGVGADDDSPPSAHSANGPGASFPLGTSTVAASGGNTGNTQLNSLPTPATATKTANAAVVHQCPPPGCSPRR